jgi:hypothetical protein
MSLKVNRPALPVPPVPAQPDSQSGAQAPADHHHHHHPQGAQPMPTALRPRPPARPLARQPQRRNQAPTPETAHDSEVDWKEPSQKEVQEGRVRGVVLQQETQSAALQAPDQGEQAAGEGPKSWGAEISPNRSSQAEQQRHQQALHASAKPLDGLLAALKQFCQSNAQALDLAQVKQFLLTPAAQALHSALGAPTGMSGKDWKALLPLLLLTQARRTASEQQGLREARQVHIQAVRATPPTAPGCSHASGPGEQP